MALAADGDNIRAVIKGSAVTNDGGAPQTVYIVVDIDAFFPSVYEVELDWDVN